MDEEKSDAVMKANDIPADPSPLPTSFAELDAMAEADKKNRMLEGLSYDFKRLSNNIIDALPPDEVDAAISKLVNEYATRADGLAQTKEKWQPLTDAVVTKMADMKIKAMTKTEGGTEYEQSDFAYVPDAEKPSAWKLRLAEGKSGNITIAQLGRAAAALSAGGFRGNRVDIPSEKVAGVKAKIRGEYKKMHVSESDMPMSVKEHTPSLMLKKQDDGTYRWLAVYSNKYRDRDKDIISDASHRRLDKMINDGTVPYPELWYWHVPGSRWGKADFHAYDDRGFSIAAGTVDVGKEHIAEAVSERGGLLVSHGMPLSLLQRDPNDKTVITKHVTIEISPLPASRAANLLTGFNILSEDNMAIKEEKKQELADMGFDVDAIDGAIGKGVEKATEVGLDFKEVDEVDETTTEAVDETVEKESLPSEEPVVAEKAADGITRDELNSVISQIGEAIKGVSDAVAALSKEVIAVKEAAQDEPVTDLRDIFQSAIGAKEAQLRKNSKLANDVPEQTQQEDGMGVPFLDRLING